MRFEGALLGIFGCVLSGCVMSGEDIDWDLVVYGGVPRAEDWASVMVTGGCSGTLIGELTPDGQFSPTSNYVLSAAHCVDSQGRQQHIGMGPKPDRNDPSKFIAITKIDRYPSSDLIVGRLASPAPIAGQALNAINLDTFPADFRKEARVVGYGTNTVVQGTDQNGNPIKRHEGYGEKRAAGILVQGVNEGFMIEGQPSGPIIVLNNALGTMQCPGDSGGTLNVTFTRNTTPVEVLGGVTQSIADPQQTPDDPNNPVQCTRAIRGLSVRVDRHIAFIEGVMAQTGAKPVVYNGQDLPVRPSGPAAPGTPGTPGVPGTPGAPGLPGAPGGGPSGDVSGGCQAGGSSFAMLPLLFLAGLLIRRQRR